MRSVISLTSFLRVEVAAANYSIVLVLVVVIVVVIAIVVFAEESNK